MDELTFETKVIWVKGLMIECPVFKALADCPLEKYRSMPLKDKLQLVDDMSEQEVDEVIRYHQECLHKREGYLTSR